MTDDTPTIDPGHPRGRFSQMLGPTFHSLRNRNFRLFFIGQTISNTGNWLTNVAFVLLVLNITGSGLAVGVLTACQYGPVLFLSPWAGAIADRSLVQIRHIILGAAALGLSMLALAFVPGVAAAMVAGFSSAWRASSI